MGEVTASIEVEDGVTYTKVIIWELGLTTPYDRIKFTQLFSAFCKEEFSDDFVTYMVAEYPFVTLWVNPAISEVESVSAVRAFLVESKLAGLI